MTSVATEPFAERVIAWHRRHGRHDLPWQCADPYRIWLSEVMLQQTQVRSVIPYFERFVAAFPTVEALAAASLDDVLAQWSGLGYYRRAQHLHAGAKRIVVEHGGVFPHDVTGIAALPGIGRSTAAAIASLAFGAREAILDGNVKRVLARYHAVEGDPAGTSVERKLWALAEGALPQRDFGTYTQAIMDLGATVCLRSRPLCAACPVAKDCRARHEGRVDSLPTPRRARVQPVREVRLLVLERPDAVLVEQRPTTGIWGGLWSLPELGAEEDALTAARMRFGCAGDVVEELAPFEHVFTHFRLIAQPLRVPVTALAPHAAAPGLRWLGAEDVAAAALPSPVKRLLAALTGSGMTRALAL